MGRRSSLTPACALRGSIRNTAKNPKQTGGGPHAEAVGSYAKDEEVRSVHSEGL